MHKHTAGNASPELVLDEVVPASATVQMTGWVYAAAAMSLPLMDAQTFCLKIDLWDGHETVILSTIPEAVVHCHMV